MSIFSKLFGSKKSGDKLVDCNDDLPEDVFGYDDSETQVIEFDNIKDANSSRVCPKDYLGIKDNSEILSKIHVAHDSNSTSSNYSDIKRQSESNSFPHSLPEAIRYVVDRWGKDYLMNRGFINVLNDFKVLNNIPASKHILLNMQKTGYIEKILKSSNWIIDSKAISSQYSAEYGAKEDIVEYLIDCIGFGLEKIDYSDEKKIVENTTLQYNPQQVAPPPKRSNSRQKVMKFPVGEAMSELTKFMKDHPDAVGDIHYEPSKSVYRVYWLAIGKSDNDIIANKEIINVNFAISENYYGMIMSLTNLSNATIEIEWPSLKIDNSRVYVDGINYLLYKENKIESKETVNKLLQPIKLKTSNGFRKMFDLNDIDREEFIYHIVMYAKVMGKKHRFTYDVYTKLKIIYKKA